MASIQEHLDKIKNAIFGKDVRQAIHDSIKQCYDDAAVNHDNANMEVKLARGSHNTLNDRLVENEKKQEKISSQLEHKANKSELTNVFNFKGNISFTSLPTSNNSINDTYYVTDKSCNYTWNGSSWYESGSSTSLPNECITYEKLNSELNQMFTEVFTDIDFTFNPGYKNKNGVVTSDNGWNYCEINVSEGQKFKITGQSWLAIALVSFLDINGSSVSFCPLEEDKNITNYTDIEIIVPKNAVKMVCNKYLSRDFSIKRRSDIFINELKLPQKSTIKTKLAIIGDSLSADDSPQATIKYHRLLAQNDDYKIINLARGGHGYKRADDGDNAFWQQAGKIPADTDIVFIFGSFNDLGKVINGEYTIGETVDNASTSVGTIMECVNKTITNIRAIKNDAIIVIASPTPWASYHPGGGANKDIAEQYVKAVETVAHNQCCIFLDLFHESNVWSWNSGWNEIYCTDGVHLNDLGHKRYLYSIIRDTLNKVNPNK